MYGNLLKFLAGSFFLFILVTLSARQPGASSDKGITSVPQLYPLELKRGDILIKPNHNWLPGSRRVPGGYGFGHAAIVIKGSSGATELDMLSSAIVFESVARDLPEDSQVREVRAYDDNPDPRLRNTNFGPFHAGHRYVLRPAIDSSRIEQLISWITEKDGDVSSWRAIKGQPDGTGKHTWYCSLILWQAYHDVLGIELDPDPGLIVYPNDLIHSAYFSTGPGQVFRF